jgi:hypothetical protein
MQRGAHACPVAHPRHHGSHQPGAIHATSRSPTPIPETDSWPSPASSVSGPTVAGRWPLRSATRSVPLPPGDQSSKAAAGSATAVRQSSPSGPRHAPRQSGWSSRMAGGCCGGQGSATETWPVSVWPAASAAVLRRRPRDAAGRLRRPGGRGAGRGVAATSAVGRGVGRAPPGRQGPATTFPSAARWSGRFPTAYKVCHAAGPPDTQWDSHPHTHTHTSHNCPSTTGGGGHPAPPHTQPSREKREGGWQAREPDTPNPRHRRL